jgi:hypothetical protein
MSAKTSCQQAPGRTLPDWLTPPGIKNSRQERHDGTDERTTQAPDQYQRLKKPHEKLERRQHVSYVIQTHPLQVLQKLDAIVPTKPRIADQYDVTCMSCTNPFVYDRGNMIYVVVMTKEEKRFHTRALGL